MKTILYSLLWTQLYYVQSIVVSLSTSVPNVNEVFNRSIRPDQRTQFELSNLTDIPPATTYILFQLHAYDEYLSLSLTQNFDPGTYVIGRDVGVVSKLKGRSGPIRWYVKSNGTKSASAFNVLGLASTHTARDPVVGGCNMEFPLENDPNLHLDHGHASNVVTFQYSRQGEPTNNRTDNCDLRNQQNLRYDMYQYYIGGRGNDSYFEAMKHMLSPTGIAENGDKVETFNYSGQTLERFASFTGEGVIYNVIARDAALKTSAPYVPVVGYGCENEYDVTCGLILADHTFGILLVVALGLVGLFLCFLGHRFFKTEMFMFGFLGTLLMAYILFLRYSLLTQPVCLALAAACGVAGGALWLSFWYFKGMPLFSVLYVGLVSGYLASSIVFNLTPLKDLIWWQQPLNYGLSFACGVVIIPVLLLAFPQMLNLASCSFVGGYLAVLAVDIFVAGNVSQIILLSLNKAVWNDFLKAKVILPYQWTDLLLIIIWGLLAVGGAVFQHIRERNRAPFPPCPWQLRRQKRYQREWNYDDDDPNNRQSTNHSPDTESDGEHTPLLHGQRP